MVKTTKGIVIKGKPQEDDRVKVLNDKTSYWEITLNNNSLYFETFLEQSSKRLPHEVEEGVDPDKWHEGFFDNSYTWKKEDISAIEFSFKNQLRAESYLTIDIHNKYLGHLIALEYEATEKDRKRMEKDLEVITNWWLG